MCARARVCARAPCLLARSILAVTCTWLACWLPPPRLAGWLAGWLTDWPCHSRSLCRVCFLVWCWSAFHASTHHTWQTTFIHGHTYVHPFQTVCLWAATTNNQFARCQPLKNCFIHFARTYGTWPFGAWVRLCMRAQVMADAAPLKGLPAVSKTTTGPPAHH